METSDERRRWIEIGVFAVAAFLLFQIRAAFFLSAVPLFLLGFRRDEKAQLYGVGLFLLAILLVTVVRLRGLDGKELHGFLLAMELGYPLSLALGVVIVRLREGRTLYKLLEATTAVAIVSVVPILIYTRDPKVTAFVGEQIRLIAEAFTEALTQGGDASSASSLLAGGEKDIVTLIRDIFFRNYLFSYFLLLSAMWALSDGVYRRIRGMAPFLLEKFEVPEQFLWPFIIGWAGVLLDVVFGLGVVGYPIWNIAMILLVIYAFSGIGILRYLFRKYGVGPGLRIMVMIASIIVLFTPGINLVLVVGVPLLGVSEYWIHFRYEEGE